MRTLLAGLSLAVAFVGCSLNESDDDSTGGEGGETAGVGGTSAGKGGSAGAGSGGTSSSQGGSAGGGGIGAGGMLGKGGSGAAAGSGGSSGSGGRGGRGGRGGEAGNGAGTGGSSAGQGGAGSSAGGSSSAGTSSGGGGGCVENLRCTLTAPASTGDLAQDCVNRINQFREECACLPPLERWTEGEDCADQMAEYDSERDEAHAGFRDDICEAGGSAQNECPGYNSTTQVVGLCLQQMWDEGPPPTEECDGACFQEYGHFINMTNEAFGKVACGFFTTSDGDVWAVQNFSR